MARQHDESKRETIAARELHAGDQIVCHDGTIVDVRKAFTRGERVRVELWGGQAYPLAPDRPVTVLTEHSCQCNGSGVFRGGGVVENGVYKGFQGQCFGCAGKGWQNRQDVIRNATYWAKYARIAI